LRRGAGTDSFASHLLLTPRAGRGGPIRKMSTDLAARKARGDAGRWKTAQA
jgi:hypothetical protein